MATPAESTRRRSPAWVRAMADKTLHGILGTMDRTRRAADLSERQEWLWDACISELEYRWRQARPGWSRCACRYCIPPFPS